MLDVFKHSSLLRTLVNYNRKKFYNIGPWTGCIWTSTWWGGKWRCTSPPWTPSETGLKQNGKINWCPDYQHNEHNDTQVNNIWQSCILPNENLLKDIKDKYIQLKGIQMNNIFWVFLIMLSRRMTFTIVTLRRMAISRMTFQHSSNEQDWILHNDIPQRDTQQNGVQQSFFIKKCYSAEVCQLSVILLIDTLLNVTLLHLTVLSIILLSVSILIVTLIVVIFEGVTLANNKALSVN